MDKIEKIRQEIEQLRREVDDHNYYLDNSEQALGYSAALDDIEKFLDTLSEEPCKGLEEAAEEFTEQEWDGLHDTNGNALYTEDYIKYTFIAGAEWQKGIDRSYFLKCYEQGKKAMKEQMLKDAVEGYVTFNYDAQKEELPCATVIANEKPLEFYESRGFKLGDNVKLIIIKDDGKSD